MAFPSNLVPDFDLMVSAARADGWSRAFGTEFWQPIYDANTATMMNSAAMAGLLLVKFTGAAGDLWNIR